MIQRNWMISNGLELEDIILLNDHTIQPQNTMLKTVKNICKSFIWQGIVLVYIV